ASGSAFGFQRQVEPEEPGGAARNRELTPIRPYVQVPHLPGFVSGDERGHPCRGLARRKGVPQRDSAVLLAEQQALPVRGEANGRDVVPADRRQELSAFRVPYSGPAGPLAGSGP